MDRPDFKLAACRGMPIDVFFPDDARRSPAAVRVCGRCPIRRACLEHAVEYEEFGIWGGRTQQEIRAIRRARATKWKRERAAHVTRSTPPTTAMVPRNAATLAENRSTVSQCGPAKSNDAQTLRKAQ